MHQRIRDVRGPWAGVVAAAFAVLFAAIPGGAGELSHGESKTDARAALRSFSELNGPREDSVLLNGQWEFCIGKGDEAAETAAGAERLEWKTTTLPGSFVKWSDEAAAHTRFAWTRRTFAVSAEQARSLAILRWNQIAFGAVAWINGRKVGENAPTGPYQVLLPEGTLTAGQNTMVLKVAGGAAVKKAKSGYFLIPAGFASADPRGVPQVTGDVWIDFARDAYMKWILALPDPAASGRPDSPSRYRPAGTARSRRCWRAWTSSIPII